MDYLMENLRPLSPLLGYAIVGFVAVATSRWTWMGLVFITFFSLGGFRGIKGFHIGFRWWGKHDKVRVMLQFFSSSSSSNNTVPTSNNTVPRKNRTAFADDNLMRIGSNMCMDDLHLFTYKGESLNSEQGIYTRRSKNRRKSSSTMDSLSLCNSVEAIDNCIEAPSPCFLQTKMMFIIEKLSSFSVAKSVPSPLRFAEKELESPTSDQQRDCSPPNLIRLTNYGKLCPADEFGASKCRSIEEPTQDCRGKMTLSSDFIYDVGWKEKCRGRGRQLGPCLLDNCVDLGLWRRLESFESQFGWDRLHSLRLGYDWNWNCLYRSGLTSDKFSKYSVREINVAKVLDSPKKSLVKLLSLQDAVSSVDMVWNMGLSCTCTIDNTVRLWDFEAGKCLNEMVVDDYGIMGSHIDNSHGFLLSGIMIRGHEKASLFVWDPRDFLKPLNFSVENMVTFHSVYVKDTTVCVSDCFSERQFDLRMITGSSQIEVCPTKLSSFMELHSN